MTWDWIAASVFAVWRITHLLVAEDGPGDLVVKLRRAAGDSAVGRALDCFYCTSVWAALPFAYLCADDWAPRALLWPALSGAAIVVERLTAPRSSNVATDLNDHARVG